MENPTVVGLTWKQFGYYGSALTVLHDAIYLPASLHSLELPESSNYHAVALVPYEVAKKEGLAVIMRPRELGTRIEATLARWLGMSMPMQEIIEDDIETAKAFQRRLEEVANAAN